MIRLRLARRPLRQRPPRRFGPRLAACLLGALGLAGCAGIELPERSPSRSEPEPSDAEVYSSAQAERIAYLEREVARLREDLRQAEGSMVTIESGLRGAHTRADAVSTLAEARIAVERASQAVTWRSDRVQEARDKLEEAERQLQAGHSGSAVFFASRARRIAEALNSEARQIARNESTRYVRARRANLRAGPSVEHRVVDTLGESTPVFPERARGDWVLVRTIAGPAGWVHTSLLQPR